MSPDRPSIIIPGMEKGIRVDSRTLEERVQKAVADGHRFIEIIAQGQHGIGGRLWKAGKEQVNLRVLGTSGQRLGSMGSPNTLIDVIGPASDDVGWLNAGARIIVRGNATNGVGNAMAQGKIFIAGNIGARGMTMTKHNPRFEPPELWVLGSVGDSFAEFMAGGIAVICGHGAVDPDNILGYRPCIGMVGGKIFFRGSHQDYSSQDALLRSLDDEEWQWLRSHTEEYLDAIDRPELSGILLSDRNKWQALVARDSGARTEKPLRDMHRFREDIWDKELGKGGLIGDLSTIDRSRIDILTTGDLRRFIPKWENRKYLPPCQANCPTGIPIQKRWELIRNGLIDQAVNLALEYTPFPATVCGYLCPHLCMDNCTRGQADLPAVDVAVLGKESLNAQPPKPAKATGHKIAVIGGGPAGLSVAWQLWLKGHQPVVYDKSTKLGGKITEHIPESRIPDAVLEHELNRVKKLIPQVNLKKTLAKEDFTGLKETNDFIVIATGAQKPRTLPVPGAEKAVTAMDFLQRAKRNKAKVGRNVVIIGAGNVGCDVATEAARLGAKTITLVDIQEPASYGVERQQAEAVGAKFLWPRTTKAITRSGVELEDGKTLAADTVVFALGDQPDLSFLPDQIKTDRGFITVDDQYRTSDPKVFAVGDTVRPGLLTEAIGAGRKAASAINDILAGKRDDSILPPPIDKGKIKLAYYTERTGAAADLNSCSLQCASCGACRDCGLCEEFCPQKAITRRDLQAGEYEYSVDADRCIGCGFCVGACPCGIWTLYENDPME